jgi:hypothetical protein
MVASDWPYESHPASVVWASWTNVALDFELSVVGNPNLNGSRIIDTSDGS